MTTSTDRVRSYLDDLARMLDDLDHADRDEVLAGVREHVDAATEGAPDPDGAADEALRRLGPPERVAAEARASLGTTTPAPVGSAGTAGAGRGVLVTGLVLLGLVALVPVLLVVVARVTLLAVGPGDGPGPFFLMHGPPEMLFLGWLPWVVGTVCLVLARHHAPGSWPAALVTGPVCLVAVGVGTWWMEPVVLSGVVGLLVLLAAAAFTARALWAAHRESR